MATGKIKSSLSKRASSIAELETIITELVSGQHSIVFLSGTVTMSLIAKNASCNAIVTKMDDVTADMLLYSLGGNYIGAVRYSTTTSSVTKEIALQRLIKNTRVTIPSVTIGPNGYIQITSYRPSSSTFYTGIVTWSQNSKQTAFAVNQFGTYLFGTAGAVITNLELIYWHLD